MKITQVQELMKQLYFEKDSRRGLEKTTLWLVSEIGELADIIVKNSQPKKSHELELSNEIADCFAWLLSIANLLEIDLEKAIIQKYPSKCPRCEKNPCQCNEH